MKKAAQVLDVEAARHRSHSPRHASFAVPSNIVGSLPTRKRSWSTLYYSPKKEP